MATADTKLMTALEFATLDIEAPVELVRGEVIEVSRPGMRHGVICKNLIFEMESWVRRTSTPCLVVSDSGILTERDPDTVRGPDVYIIQRERLPPQGITPGFLDVSPDLCVEVFSPHDLWKDVIAEVDEYLQAGVREVWVIEPNEQQVYVYRPDGAPRTLGLGETVTSTALAGLQLQVTEIFRA